MNLDRLKDAPWLKTDKETPTVIIGGAGGIGTWLTLLLVRAGFATYVYDFDTVEHHNMGGQLFKKSDLSKYKVDALKATVQEFTEDFISVNTTAYTNTSMTSLEMFSAFDNMLARKVMFENWKTKQSDLPGAIFIDGRLTAEQMQIFCVTKDKIEEYEKHLFDDSEVADAPCTFKQTSHSAAMIASHMVGFFTNHITNVMEDNTDRNVPFYWEYYIPIDYIKVIQ
jgi:molybdopterin/thiamine biosynthesis adenylyltransferase